MSPQQISAGARAGEAPAGRAPTPGGPVADEEVLAALSGPPARRPGPPRVRLLGSVDVLGGRPLPVALREQANLAAVFLVLHPGSSPQNLGRAMWPFQRIPDSALDQLVHRVRWSMASEGRATSYLSATSGGVLGFTEDVTSDWADFQHLHAQGQRSAGVDGDLALAQALGLVRDRPLTGIDTVKHQWAGSAVEAIAREVAAAAHALARRRLEKGDFPSAALATGRGLQAMPTSPQLLHDLRRVQDAVATRE